MGSQFKTILHCFPSQTRQRLFATTVLVHIVMMSAIYLMTNILSDFYRSLEM